MKIVSGTIVLIGGIVVGGWLVGQGVIPESLLPTMDHALQPLSTPGMGSAEPGMEGSQRVDPQDPNLLLASSRSDKQPDEKLAEADVTISASMVNHLGVRTATVKAHDLKRRIDTVGYISFDETQISHIQLKADGWIERLAVQAEGERVKKGQLLFEFYSPALVKAQEEFLQAISTRNKQLIRAAELRLQSLGLNRHQIERVRKMNRVYLRVAFYAPQDGIVSELLVRQGIRVSANMTIMSLADLSHVWLQTEVFERQADWVVPGADAQAHLSYLPGTTWQGRVDYIYPSLTPKTRTLKVRLRFENPDERMKPNMYAKVSIFGEPKEGVLAIPREAVIRSGKGERTILALGEGRFKARTIRVGMESDGLVEVLSGLEKGEKVVTSAQFLIDSQASLSGGLHAAEIRGDYSNYHVTKAKAVSHRDEP